MADIEDRITKHSHAFEGLLLLVPASEKRKLTKSEKRKEAKQGKPGHEAVKIDKGKVIRVGKKEDRRESEKSVGVATIVDGEKRRQAKKQQKQKPKSSSKQQGKAHNETSITEAEFGDVDDDTETKRVEKKKLVSKTPPQKKTKMEASIQTKEPSQKPHKPSGPLSRAIPKIPINLSTELALESSLDSTIALSPSITSTTPDPQSNSTETLAQDPAPKSEVSPEERSNARARLAAHIASLRSKRKADGTAADSRHALLETRQKKEAARKERKKSLRLASKLTEGPSPTADTPSLIRPPPIEVDSKPKNDFLFGAVTFDDGQELDHTLADFKKTRKRKGPTDVMGQLKHVEAKKARLENMDPEKAGRIYEKEMWGRALKQTVGEKVRDDEKLLKKALKRQQGEKRKSEREWKERKGSVAKGIAIRQKKREENINARKEQKKLGKAGKKVKTSGKKKMQKTKKGGSKPGFEGRMKSGKPAGKSGGGGGGWKRLEK